MIYKKVLVPDRNNHTIEMPEQFFGKKVEVIVMELGDSDRDASPSLPAAKKVSMSELFENFGVAPDFPSIDEIRGKTWPNKW